MNIRLIKQNYEILTDDIRRICDNIGRNYEEITLIAVSKTFPASDILELHNLGQTEFGENKVQEMSAKHTELVGQSINWHLIGHLQTNKIKYIIDFVKLIHSVDSVKLALEINKYAEKAGRIIDILVQVNTSFEPQKSGSTINESRNLCEKISALEFINLRGLMTIGLFTDDTEIIRNNFRALKRAFDEIKPGYRNFDYLSMGMTSDYEIALTEGSNMLRIGSAIFGSR